MPPKTHGARSGKRPKSRKAPFKLRHSLANRLRKESESEANSEGEESASRKKLQDKPIEVCEQRKDWSGFRLLDIDRVFSKLAMNVVCKHCHGDVKITEKKRSGMSCVFETLCSGKCGVLNQVRNSTLVDSDTKETEVNRRLAYATQAVGYAGMQQFCAFMDLPPPLSRPTYSKTVNAIHEVVKREAEKSMLRATEEEVLATGSRDIGTSNDGSWQKRGFSSKNGLVSAIGIHTGKVLDVEVMSTICHSCSSYRSEKKGDVYDEWRLEHNANCQINHEGSPSMMEVNGMKRIYARSEQRGKVRYCKFIGDGDTKTFKNVVDSKPYGDELVPSKIECTGHVQKRVSGRMRKLKKDLAGEKLSGGKGLGGKGRLTDKMIDKMATFYGIAVRTSTDVPSMKRKIWAIYHHYLSNDAKPQHQLCPQGQDSWCPYQKAASIGATYQHKSSLPEAVMLTIKPIFVELTKDDLLERCVGGFTQNANESFNSTVWKSVPKNSFCGRKMLEVGVSEAILLFNDGRRSQNNVLEDLNICPGRFCVSFLNNKDRARINKAEQRAQESTKEARKARRRVQKEKEESTAAQEGTSYSAGGF